MFLAHAYKVEVVSPFNIFEELKITENVLSKWNKKYSYNRNMCFLLGYNYLCGDSENSNIPNDSEDPDLMIAIFWTNFGYPMSESTTDSINQIKGKIANRIEKNRPVLVYFVEKHIPISTDWQRNEDLEKWRQEKQKCAKRCFRECSEEDFEFILTCDISAFDALKNDIVIKYGVVNIKVKEALEEDNFGEVTYLVSSIVNSPRKQMKYRDHIIVQTKDSTDKAILLAFNPKETILNPDQRGRNNSYLEYEVEIPDNGILTGAINVKQKLRKKKGGIGLHVPYETKYLIVNIDIEKAMFIEACNPEVKLTNRDPKKPLLLNYTLDYKSNCESSANIYNFSFDNIPADSDISFEWNKQGNNNN